MEWGQKAAGVKECGISQSESYHHLLCVCVCMCLCECVDG